MKKILLFFLLTALTAPAIAQTGVPQLTAFSQDSAKNIFETSAAGYRIVWSYYSYCTYNLCFNDGVLLQVYDSSGTKLTSLVWEKPYVSSSNTQSKISIKDATVDKDNNLILVGSFRCKVNFSPNDPAPTYFNGDSTWSNSGTMFLAKYRVTDGHFLWAKLMKKADPDPYSYPMFGFASLATDNSSNIYLMGLKISGAVDINTGTGAPAVYDYPQQFLAKYNSAGVYQTSVAADAYSLYYYKTLRFLNNNLYGIGAIDSGGRQTYLLKQYNLSTLATTKRKNFGHFNVDGVGAGRLQRVELVMAKNDIWLMGGGVGNVFIPSSGNTLNLTGLPSGVRAFYLMRMDNAWNLTDARLLQKTTSQIDCPVALGVDSLQNLMIAGSVTDSINAALTGGNTWIKSGKPFRSNTYLLYYTGSNLALQWAKQIGDTSDVGLTMAVFGAARNIYFTGSFKGKTSFSFSSGGTAYTGPSATGWYTNNYYARYKWPTASLGTAETPSITIGGSGWRLYPNPAATVLRIRLDDQLADEALVVSVYAMDGRLLKVQPTQGVAHVQVDVAALPPGAYFISVASSGGSEMQRFVKGG